MKRDANEIEAKVLKVGTAEIEYKRWDNLEGPIYTIPARNVFVIKYQNGTKETISPLSASGSKYGRDFRPHYQGEIAVAYGLGVGEFSQYINLDRILFETVHGYRFSPYFFAGLGLGFNYFYKELSFDEYIGDSYYIYGSPGGGVLSYALNLKGYLPFSDKSAVYLSWDLGADSGVSGYMNGGTEFYTAIGPGVQFGHGDFGIRFQHMGAGTNAVLFRVGVNF